MRIKRMTIEQGMRVGISRFPNFHKTGSVRGMKKLYYGYKCLLVRCGSYVNNVSAEPQIYHQATFLNYRLWTIRNFQERLSPNKTRLLPKSLRTSLMDGCVPQRRLARSLPEHTVISSSRCSRCSWVSFDSWHTTIKKGSMTSAMSGRHGLPRKRTVI